MLDRAACDTPQPGIEPTALAVELQNLNQHTTREVLVFLDKIIKIVIEVLPLPDIIQSRGKPTSLIPLPNYLIEPKLCKSFLTLSYEMPCGSSLVVFSP